jgi:hypothetical protein
LMKVFVSANAGEIEIMTKKMMIENNALFIIPSVFHE